MSIGNLLMYCSIIFSIGGIILSVLHLKKKDKKYLNYSKIVTLLLFVTISIALAYIYFTFLTSDLSLEYVWRYSRVTHPIQYKFAGVLAGMSGSLLFWIWAIIAPWFYEEIKTIKKPNNESIQDWIRIVLFSVIVVLVFILLLHDIFKQTAINLLAAYPQGQGLNPLLQNEYMVIHPPIVFLAYGFLVIPFASTIANLITGNKKWTRYSIKWSRVSWIFLTFGIGLGAIWAYIVLGWGGYWSWDPVETSSLLPWIVLTGFLHTQLMYKRKNDYRLMAPIMGIFSFIFVIFATFVTRAGGLWVSVHTFGEANVQIDPWQRFLNILSESQTVFMYFIFLIATLVIVSILVFYRYQKDKKGSTEQFFTINELISDNVLMLLTVFMFITTTIVTLVILISGVNGLDPNDFNSKVGALSLIIVILLIICLLWRNIGRKRIMVIGTGTLIASIICVVFYPQYSIVAFSLPILIVALVGTVFKILYSFNTKQLLKSLKPVSAHIIHLSIILLFLGYAGSNFLVIKEDLSLTVGEDGEKIGKYTIYATDIGIIDGINFVNIDADTQNYVYQTEFVDVKVLDGSNIIGNQRLIKVIATSLVNGENSLLRNEIKIIDTPIEDLYFTFQQIYGDNTEEKNFVDVNIKILPLMKLLWGGMWLMIIGMILRVFSDRKINRDRQINTENYYEELVEKQLKN